MSHTSILADDSTIHNFISKMCSPLYFSEPARKNIANFITGASQKGYRGKVTDIVDLGFLLVIALPLDIFYLKAFGMNLIYGKS